MTINIGRRQFISVLGSVAAAWPLAANAAVAPEYRWESAAPSIVLVAPEGVGGQVILKSLAITMDCGHDCVVTSSYLLASAQAQSVQVAVLSGEPSTLRIQLQGRAVTTSSAREADPAALDRIGVPILQQPGLSTVAVTLPVAAGPNEITVVEHASLSTRGRGTNAVVRAVEIIPAPLRGWNLAPEFTFSTRLGYGGELLADLKAAGLKDEPITPLCVRYGGDRDPSTVSLGTVEGSGGREYFTASFDRDFPATLSWQIGNAAAARYWN
jgi:hypothetical protein